MQDKFYVNKVAILGAGVMGAQIAAHFANARINTVLFDLNDELVTKSITNLKKINPKPLAWDKSLDYITKANYDNNLEQLKSCDLIIEAIAERLDWKEELYHKISSYINTNAIIASNTSGLSIMQLAKCLPENLRSQFCGIHFFNPPRYMSLVELIPHSATRHDILTNLESFLVSNLGKNVVIARDTPNFIANRVGVFSMLAACVHTQEYDIPIEVVDKLTGSDLGRAKSATYRTADVVGLDTFTHVVNTMTNNCHDGFESFYQLPQWVANLIKKGHLGQKTKAGFYQKKNDGLYVLDIKTEEYRLSDKKASPDVIAILKEKNWAVKLDKLRNCDLVEAKFLWALFRDIFHYSACMLGDITDSPRNIDVAIRSGFGWREGIFETWQQGGWLKIANWIKEDIDNGLSLVNKPLPKWVFEIADGVYQENKVYNVESHEFEARKLLPVYSRQLFPDLVLNEKPNVEINIIYENDGVKLWNTGDDIGILSFKSKMCTIGMDVLTGISEAIKIAETKCSAMVIWQEKDIFSAGANLEEFGFSIMMNGQEAVDQIIEAGHKIIVNQLRYAKIPVVAAVKGYAFGGGCEILLHCSAVVAALESYIGLIEAGVGLLPGWGGTTEMALRASLAQDPWKEFELRYKNLAMAKVASSAYEALELGFLKDSDTIVMNTRELLYVAKKKAQFLVESGYKAPIKPNFAVFGEQGIATVNALLANMHAGNQISDHDLFIAKNIAITMCGGFITKGSVVNEDWVLKLEKEKFIELATSDKTADRIQYMLENGKPLRN
jgi:3-hydroxyacyl-CoA dehydrogenase